MPVLMIHGRSDNLEAFCHLLKLLPTNHYYVCIDLPCHGQSAHADKGYILDLQWYSLCVKRVIDYFKWTKLYFIGHSLGGQIGFILAAVYPQMISKLIIIEAMMYFHIPPTDVAQAVRLNVLEVISKLEKRVSDKDAPIYSFSEFLKKMKETRATETSEDQMRAMAKRNLTKVGLDQYKYSNDQRTKFFAFTYINAQNMENLASKICCPTLIILGKHSFTKPEQTLPHVPESQIKNVTFKVINGDHDIHLARSKEVASIVVPFLTVETKSKL